MVAININFNLLKKKPEGFKGLGFTVNITLTLSIDSRMRP